MSLLTTTRSRHQLWHCQNLGKEPTNKHRREATSTTSAAKLNERQANERTWGIRCYGMYYSLPLLSYVLFIPCFANRNAGAWWFVCIPQTYSVSSFLLAQDMFHTRAWHKQPCQPSHPTRGTVFRHWSCARQLEEEYSAIPGGAQ